MKFNRYWAREKFIAYAPTGEKLEFNAWAGSQKSQQQAQTLAREKAQAMADKILAKQINKTYLYSDQPLREAIIEENYDQQGNLLAIITRNSYGSLVLNTERVMFIDIDSPVPTFSFTAWLGQLLGKPKSDFEQQALEKIKNFLTINKNFAMRVYRTRAGLRCLVSHAEFSPTATDSTKIMTELGVDPLYQKLCAVQESFRARLTPKCWRCGLARPSVRFPFEGISAEQAMRDWEHEYNRKLHQFKTCQLLFSHNKQQTPAAIAQLIDLHDRYTCSEQITELA